MNRVRSIAICVFSHHDRILVFEGFDPVKKQTFYRPLGGEIEFGERSENTIRRELMEEIGALVTDVQYLGALENIFTFNGYRGHEVILIYDGRLIDSGLYDQPVVEGKEANGTPIRAMWKSIHEFGEGKSILYPDGLLEMLKPTEIEVVPKRAHSDVNV